MKPININADENDNTEKYLNYEEYWLAVYEKAH